MRHLALFFALLPFWTFAQAVSVGTISPTACAGQNIEIPYTVRFRGEANKPFFVWYAK